MLAQFFQVFVHVLPCYPVATDDWKRFQWPTYSLTQNWTIVFGIHLMQRHFGSIYVSGKMPSYPSPKLTLTVTSHLLQNDGLREE